MKALVFCLIITNLIQLICLIAYRVDYGSIGEHKNLCEQKLQKGNAPRNVKCVLAKEVFVPEEV